MPIRIIIYIILLLSACDQLCAQSVLSGSVKDVDGVHPIASANVALYSGDSSLIAGVSSDEQGKFKLKQIISGDYILKVSCIGFQTLRMAFVVGKESLELGDIKLLPHSNDLQEVVVSGKSGRTFDRELIYPSSRHIKYSTNGLTLLHSLGLVRLKLDLVHNQVTTFEGGEVGFCINGKPVTEIEILAIRPEDVLRVEYHDRPGLRYGNKAAVVDYILKVKETGGMLALDLTIHLFPVMDKICL